MSANEHNDTKERAEAAEAEVRQILKALKEHCSDDFVVIIDGAIDWRATIDEFVDYVQTGMVGR